MRVTSRDALSVIIRIQRYVSGMPFCEIETDAVSEKGSKAQLPHAAPETVRDLISVVQIRGHRAVSQRRRNVSNFGIVTGATSAIS